jgi:hypothetical protein
MCYVKRNEMRIARPVHCRLSLTTAAHINGAGRLAGGWERMGELEITCVIRDHHADIANVGSRWRTS